MTDDPLAYLRATLDVVQAEARAASTETGSAFWRGTTDGLYSDDASNHPGPFLADSYGYNPPEIVTHVARHDPAAVLRRIAADRKLLERHEVIECKEFGCDCHSCCETCRWTESDERGTKQAWGELTRHVYPCPTIRLIAEGWGWTEKAT